MNKKEAHEIIRNYQKNKGFFDLSIQPDTLSDIEYAKILRLQNFLAEQNQKSEYLRKFNPIQWEKLKNLAARLQQIILQYWTLDELDEKKQEQMSLF